MSGFLIPASHAYELKVANKYPWFSPTRVLIHYLQLKSKVGMDTIETQGKYQKVREMKAVSLLLLGIMKNQGVEFWLQPVLEESAPDVRTFCLGLDKQGVIEQWVQAVEVIEYGEHSEGDIANFIWQKKFARRKAYPPYFVILCEIRKNIFLPPLKTLNRQLLKLNPSTDVLIIGRLDPVKEIYRIAQIYPKIDLIEEFDAATESRRLHSYLTGQGRHHTMRLTREANVKELKLVAIPGEAPGPFDRFLKETY